MLLLGSRAQNTLSESLGEPEIQKAHLPRRRSNDAASRQRQAPGSGRCSRPIAGTQRKGDGAATKAPSSHNRNAAMEACKNLIQILLLSGSAMARLLFTSLSAGESSSHCRDPPCTQVSHLWGYLSLAAGPLAQAFPKCSCPSGMPAAASSQAKDTQLRRTLALPATGVCLSLQLHTLWGQQCFSWLCELCSCHPCRQTNKRNDSLKREVRSSPNPGRRPFPRHPLDAAAHSPRELAPLRPFSPMPSAPKGPGTLVDPI